MCDRVWPLEQELVVVTVWVEKTVEARADVMVSTEVEETVTTPGVVATEGITWPEVHD